MLSSHGEALVEGDALAFEVGPGARALLTTQSEGEVCRSTGEGRSKVVATLVDAGPGNLASSQFMASCDHSAAPPEPKVASEPRSRVGSREAHDRGERLHRRQLAAKIFSGEEGPACWQVHRPGLPRREGTAGGRPTARALEVHTRFDADCLAVGKRALDFCEEKALAPVVVLGRSYTIYNTVLSSSVPAILREKGAVDSVDCYPIEDTSTRPSVTAHLAKGRHALQPKASARRPAHPEYGEARSRDSVRAEPLDFACPEHRAG